MSTKVEGMRLSDWLRWEQDRNASRKLYTALTGNTFVMGQPVALNNARKLIPITGLGDEVQTYTPDAAPSGGTFRLNLWHKDGYFVETGDIAYNATNTQIATAINAVLGTSAVTVAGTAATTIAVTFGGTGYTGLTFPLGWMILDNLVGTNSAPATRSTSAGYPNETQVINYQGTLSAGSTRLEVVTPNGAIVRTNAVAYDATIANFISALNTALDAATGITGGIVASGTLYTAVKLTYSGTGYAGQPWPRARVVLAMTGETYATVSRLSLHPSGIMLQDVDASSGDVANCPVLVRNAVVDGDRLAYVSGDPAFMRACLSADLGIESLRESSSFNVGN